jgi:phosphoglucosamine mutase
MTKFPQTLVNVRVNKAINLAKDEAVLAIVTSVEKRLGREGRVLLRASGTEPLIRVMVEGRDLALTQNLANEIASVIKTSMEDA